MIYIILKQSTVGWLDTIYAGSSSSFQNKLKCPNGIKI